MMLGIREDIIDQAMDVCYERYMEQQKFAFTAHCAAEAWLQIIDWYYFRHDPGEESSAYPPADIPNRELSWIPDDIPEPSPKDTWCRHDLEVGEAQEEACYCSCSSSDMVVGIQKDEEGRIGETKEDEESCACDSNIAESSPCECSLEKSKDGEAEASSSNSNYPNTSVRKMDSSPHGPVSSECGGGDSSSGTKPTRTKNIFSRSTLGRSKQTLPPISAVRPTQISSKTRRK
ncbi:uncharacterized protein LOC121735205 isoform X2 [Aricia agestis]|nr:uncharacterized protein LOC121735205 isoform X2 [Aricia agestis]